ncbi:Zn-dependent protease/CBS domain-containing protein [Kribbella aluminosa]|uniref:Zinc metalloprotease n=1 Tax=Kribbella aluminosa TaxID=416017 RepID=A0ABS4UM30_9ACTN|nr:M50 family metallopeptidase [Kribbella aluminosa]MBP2352680.1 Zn-dependent protease/CBS domain-containing protein [Kribbella aluminosa]
MADSRDPDNPAPPAGPTPPGTWVLGRVRGIRLTMRFTWLPVAMLLALGFATIIGQQFPSLGGWRYVAAFAFVVAFTFSILVHELAHALMAMRFGIGVTEINLGFFAAGTHIEGERKSPLEEFAVSVVGPVASLLVGGVAYFGSRALDEGVGYVALWELGIANLIVGVTNLLPGLPLDGGWVLRAIVWKITGNMHTGTVAAAWAGRGLAILVLAGPVIAEQLWGWQPSIIDFVIALLIGFFLWSGSTASLMQARLRRKLPALQVRTLARRAVAVHAGTPLSEAVRMAGEAQAGAVVVIDGDGKPHALVSESAVAAVAPNQRPWTMVSEVSSRIGAGHIIGINDTGEEILATLREQPASEYLVLDAAGGVYGVLATADVERAFRAR